MWVRLEHYMYVCVYLSVDVWNLIVCFVVLNKQTKNEASKQELSSYGAQWLNVKY